MPVKIAPTAIVSLEACLDEGVEIGAYSIIGRNVQIGANSIIKDHVIIDQNTKIGKNCIVYPFASLGTAPQDLTYKMEPTLLEIGDNNTVREFTTINRGTVKGGGITRIGHNNYLMAYVHIAHDVQIGNNTIFINGATLAGHVEVEDFAVIGAFSSVHQFVRIGRNAYIGGYTVVLQDVLPFAKIAQNRDNYCFYGPNSIGMMRNGYRSDYIQKVKELFEIIFYSDLNTSQAVDYIRQSYPQSEEAEVLIEFIAKSKRGLLKNFRQKNG